jgi:hypothetical protein
MGLLSGQNTTIENGDKKILELKFMEGLSQAMLQKFAGTTYNSYHVMGNVNDILRRTTIHHLIDLHFTNQEVLEFLNLDDVDTFVTTYDIQDPSERGSFIKVCTNSGYAKMVLNGDYRISVDVHSRQDNISCLIRSVLITKLPDGLFRQVKRALLSVRLRFSERFMQETCDYVFRKFGYIQ